MAVFKNRPDEWSRLDWNILQHGAISLYFRHQLLLADTEWLKDHGYHVYGFDCSRWISEEVVHADISKVLNFPDQYGRNMNAFNDHLAELDVPESGGCALRFLMYDLFAARLPTAAQILLDIIEVNSRRFLLTGRRLLALVQSDDPRIRFEPVGACAVMWNYKERLEASRGL